MTTAPSSMLPSYSEDLRVKSLTPQRKHRKLLKDGSGSEVWPEHIEHIFVEGLRQYWQSPYAVPSGGRSRWRNQYLVDYLGRQGIKRTKKQVASHLQVLRNMWRGEPEFYLVAGADEFYSQMDSDSPSKHRKSSSDRRVKRGERSTSKVEPDEALYDFEDSDHSSDASTSPLFCDMSDFSSPSSINTSLYSLSPSSPCLSTLSPASPSTSAFCDLDPHSSGLAGVPVANTQSPVYESYVQHMQPSVSVRKLELATECMTAYPVDIKSLGPVSDAYPSLRIHLGLPLISDARSPPTVHGFETRLELNKVWSQWGRCITRVICNGVPQSEHVTPLEITGIVLGVVNASVSETALTRCRWLDPAYDTVISQEMVVDGQTILHVSYTLDRSPPGGLPHVRFVSSNGLGSHTGPSNSQQNYAGAYPNLPAQYSQRTSYPSNQPTHKYTGQLLSALTPNP